MRVLIIGGTHLTGPHVVRGLVELAHQVTIFHRGTTEADLPSEVRHIHGDRTAIANYGDEFRECAPEVVVDMMSMAEDDTQRVMQTFKGIARRIVGISSEDVYRAYGVLWGREPGPPQNIPLSEDADLRSVHFLEGPAREKILAERAYMSEPTLPGTVLRYPMVYGPHDGGRIVDPLQRMDDGRHAILLERDLARWRWSRGYAENVAHATVLAVVHERAIGRTYNVAEPDAQSMAVWIREIGRVAGWHGEVITLPEDQLPEHLRMPHNWEQDWVVDTRRIRGELGYRELITREEALRRTVAWWRDAPADAIDPPFIPQTSADVYAAEDAVLARMGISPEG